MRVTYHPAAEGELIEITRFYERRVANLGAEFLKAMTKRSQQLFKIPSVGGLSIQT